ncbi:MAG: hypothetical protein KKA42_15565 [candidate division Zixibacteria bacterium]|nr:hypothetical protein [candidate division Zixibacteria bacterium]
MNMNTCPKCHRTDIDRGKLMSAGGIAYKSDLHLVVLESNCRAYACLDCGYTENYVDPEYLRKVREKRLRHQQS